ncbi:hypothetical protein D3C81_2111070 [compost metagenome]
MAIINGLVRLRCDAICHFLAGLWCFHGRHRGQARSYSRSVFPLTPVGAGLLAMRPVASMEIYRSCNASARARMIGLSR